jgi:hypothetical protein
MKPTLSVLLGAGSTMKLFPEEPIIGMPSTADLTKRIANMNYPEAVHRGTADRLRRGARQTLCP